jgi:hypothetical protein
VILALFMGLGSVLASRHEGPIGWIEAWLILGLVVTAIGVWKRRWTAVVLAVILADTGLVAFQWHEIHRFDAEIAEHVPTLAEPDRSDWVSACFEVGVVLLPFLMQFILVPWGIWAGWKTTALSLRRWDLGLAAMVVSLAAVVWLNSLMGVAYLVGAFD